MDVQQTVKNVGDAAAGTVVVSSWMDWIQGGLEIVGLILAVLYGAARLYDTKMYRDFVAWLRRTRKS